MTELHPTGPRPAVATGRRGFRLTLRALMVIPVLAAVAIWLYRLEVQRGLRPVTFGIKGFIRLDLLVLDDATGLPIPGARVDQPWLKPSWRDRPDLGDLDLKEQIYPARDLSPPCLADGRGGLSLSTQVHPERRLEYRVHGLVPVVGSRRFYFHPIEGVRVRADGYATWVRYLHDVGEEGGRPPVYGRPFPIVVRLKRASPGPARPR